MTAAVSADDLIRFRMSSQRIEPAAGQVVDVAAVVTHQLATQAQDFAQGVWAIGCRVPGSTRDDVLAAMERGEVVRSWPMRGTLHLVSPSDLRWMLRLTAPRQISGVAARHRELGLDAATFDRAADVAVEVLGGGRRLTRDEFRQRLDDAGIATTGQRGPHILGVLAQRAVLCWGPPAGGQQALVLLDEWAPEASELERDESLREFVLRYLRGHGPATLKDFCWWSKLTVADAKIGLQLARDELVELSFEDTSYFLSKTEADAAPPAIPSAVHALPGFDEYILGYQDRSLILAPDVASRIVPGNNGIFLPMIVSNGHVVGTWRRALGKAAVTVTPVPFTELSARELVAFSREAERFGRFLGLPARVAAA